MLVLTLRFNWAKSCHVAREKLACYLRRKTFEMCRSHSSWMWLFFLKDENRRVLWLKKKYIILKLEEIKMHLHLVSFILYIVIQVIQIHRWEIYSRSYKKRIFNGKSRTQNQVFYSNWKYMSQHCSALLHNFLISIRW